jgi:hypothetical protein
MLGGLPILMLMTVQAATAAPPEAPVAETAAAEHGFYGPVVPAPPKPKVKPVAAVDACKPIETKDVKDDTREIVVCAQKVEGFRIDPDVLKAQRIKKKNKARGPERLVDNSCASIGPMGCRGGAGINLVAAAVTAATMLQRAASGGDVGEMFITDPQPDEYKIYMQVKREREAAELEAAEKAKAKAAAEAAKANGTPTTR